MAKSEERRQVFRNKDYSLVRISRASGAEGEISNLVDVSTRGVNFVYRGEINVGEELFIKLSIPQEGGTFSAIHLRGKVIWTKPIRGSASRMVGTSFFEDAALPKQDIEKLIKARWRGRVSSSGSGPEQEPWYARFLGGLFGRHS